MKLWSFSCTYLHHREPLATVPRCRSQGGQVCCKLHVVFFVSDSSVTEDQDDVSAWNAFGVEPEIVVSCDNERDLFVFRRVASHEDRRATLCLHDPPRRHAPPQ